MAENGGESTGTKEMERPENEGESTGTKEMERPKRVDQNTISIIVKSQDGRPTYFKIRRESPMRKLLMAYCQKHFLDFQATRFFYDGQRLAHFDKTPNELKMEDHVEIECMVQMLGGGNMNSSSSSSRATD